MKSSTTVIFFLTGLILFFSWSMVFSSGYRQKVYVIPVSGTVEPGMAAYIKRALDEIEDKENAVIVFNMDTFGGRVDSALNIVDTISNTPAKKTIAFVEKRAISAGALIALSSNLLFMKNNTIIGDCAPMIQTQEGQKMAGEKVQTVLRAKFRALAKKNNYPVKLAESMVSPDMEIYKIVIDSKAEFIDQKAWNDLTEKEREKISSKKTIVAKGELLTMDDAEAHDLGFSTKSVKNIEKALSAAGYESFDLMTIEESWSEGFVRFLQPFLPIMMLLGIGAVYTEIKAPGFGFPGVAGIILLGLVFFNQYLVGLADYTELLIIIIGVLLLGVEVFILPGFGIAGTIGLLIIASGLILSFQDFVLPDPELPWESALLMKNFAMVSASFLLAFLLSLFLIRFILPSFSRIVKGPYLDADLKSFQVDSTSALSLKEGDKGTAHTFLRPSGKIMVNNKKIDAIAMGEFIAQGTSIIIDKIDGNRIIVRPESDKNREF